MTSIAAVNVNSERYVTTIRNFFFLRQNLTLFRRMEHNAFPARRGNKPLRENSDKRCECYVLLWNGHIPTALSI